MTSLDAVTALAREIGPFTEEETARAEAFLDEASDLAREIGLASWTEAGGSNPAPVSVRLAVRRAARRAFTEDPDGFSQESLGDWNGSRPRTGLDESGVYFTAAEERKIAAAAGRRTGAFSVRTPSAFASTSGVTFYAPVVGEGQHLPILDEVDL